MSMCARPGLYCPSPQGSLADVGNGEGHTRVIGVGAGAERLNTAPLPPGTADAMEKARVSTLQLTLLCQGLVWDKQPSVTGA
jgi:hypothetical protein